MLLSGKRALLEQLRAEGVRYIFGNPGTTEQAFMNELPDYPEIQFVLALHEGIAVSMADAYARLSRKPAFVELHTAAGVANAMGMLLNARETHTALVVYAGQLASGGLFQEPLLSGPIVDIARPACKWVTQVEHAHDLPQALRRAFKYAADPPQAPVLLAVPIDVMDEVADVHIVPTSYTHWHARPDENAVLEASRVLLEAQHPLVVVGDGVALSDASAETTALAETLGAPIVDYLTSEFTVAASHPLFMGAVPLGHPEPLRELLAGHDAVLVVGAPVFPVIFPKAGIPVVPDGLRIVQIDTHSWELGKNYAPTVSILADPKHTLDELNVQIRRNQTPADVRAAEQRSAHVAEQSRARRAEASRLARAGWERVPISAGRLMCEIKMALPDNALVFAESSSNRAMLDSVLAPDHAGRLVHARGSGLGPGLPGALGAQLASPDRKVVGICSDGAAMFSSAALWTAAHYAIPVTYVMLNNGAYRVLKLNMLDYRGADAPDRPFVAMDLTHPALRFDRMAESLGVTAWRVERPEQLASALSASIAHPGPSLVDVVMESPLTR